MKKYIPNSKDYFVDIEGNIYKGERRLKKNSMGIGYQSVSIRYLDGKIGHHLVHRLVAQAFLDNPENKPVVNHKNLVKHDNRLVNLEWVTYQENNQHMHDNNANRDDEGVAFWAIYSKDQIVKVCEMLRDGRRNVDIEKETKVSNSVVYAVRARIIWLDISKDYEFREKSRQRKISTETIHWICKQIVSGRSNIDIAVELGNKVSRQDVCKIRVGLLYSDISKQYF